MHVKSILFPVALAALLLPTGCNRQAAGEGGGPGGGRQAPPPQVRYTEVRPTGIERKEELPGRVVSYQVAEIRPQVSGIIQSRLFEEGTRVEEGQKLYQIDPSRYEAELQLAEATLEDAKARLENARAQAKRFGKLIETNAVSRQQYDDAVAERNRARAGVAMAEAEVRAARINLDYTSVHSPISGYIGPSNVTKGALVTARQETALATVRQLDPVYVDLSQTAAEASELRKRLGALEREGGEAEFPVTLYPGNSEAPYAREGVLDAADLSVDPRTGAIRLRSIFPNPDVVLLPGMFVRASIGGMGREEAILAPQKAVRIGKDGGKTVWTVDAAGKARRQPIRTAGTYENSWIVREGLEAGDRLIVEGTLNLGDGAPVRAEEAAPDG